MSYRTAQLYVEQRTLKRLRTALKLWPQRQESTGGELMPCDQSMTPDELANKLLDEAIKEKYPDVLRLEKALAKTEREFLEGIKK